MIQRLRWCVAGVLAGVALGVAPIAVAQGASAVLGVATLQHQSLEQVVARGNDATSCPVERRATSTIRLGDSRAIYVEPMAFAAGETSQLHAGHPVYVWKKIRVDSARLDSSAAVAGVVVRGSAVAALPAPANGIVTNFRLRAEGRWFHAVFARATPPAKQGHEPTFVSYWFGRTDGITWDSLEALPIPTPDTLISGEASQLVRVGATLMLAVPFGNDRKRDVAVYVREQGRWRVEIVRTGVVAYVALAASGNVPLLYVVRPDTTNLPSANSLSLFSRENDTWRDRGFLLHGGNKPIHHPAAREQRSGWTLSWITNDRALRQRTAHAARLARDGTFARRTVLADNIMDFSPVHSASDPTRWIVTTNAGGQQLVTLLEWGDDDPTVRDIVVNPFEGHMLAYDGPDGAAAVGPVLDRAPGAESLVSGALRFALRCNSRASGGPSR